MEKPVAGDVVVVPFPQTDLATGKRRPALVLVSLSGEDVILCQITSKFRSDGYSVVLENAEFASGSLQQTSFIRPNRLFTVHRSVIAYRVGSITPQKLRFMLNAVSALFRQGGQAGTRESHEAH